MGKTKEGRKIGTGRETALRDILIICAALLLGSPMTRAIQRMLACYAALRELIDQPRRLDSGRSLVLRFRLANSLDFQGVGI